MAALSSGVSQVSYCIMALSPMAVFYSANKPLPFKLGNTLVFLQLVDDYVVEPREAKASARSADIYGSKLPRLGVM